ncbi:MAG: hypothetical protein JKX80_02450 [Candidatus Pacebacteria bacterium]|nr:hypothetical protein [Candidatus Paceibacterota bacterium]
MTEKKSFSTGNVIFAALLGGVGAAVLGFMWGDWYTAGGAKSLAEKTAKTAVTQSVTPFCIKSFEADESYATNLATLKGKSSGWNRTAFVEKGPWAKPSKDARASRSVAEACAEKLYKG